MTHKELLVWAERYVRNLAGECLLAAAKAEAYDSFLWGRQARLLHGIVFRLYWCIKKAKDDGDYSFLWAEWDRAHGQPVSVRVERRSESRVETAVVAGAARPESRGVQGQRREPQRT